MLPQQNRKPAQFRPPIMRLQSPFNRQGAQLTKVLFLSDLLHRQINRQFHGEFIFTFSTNINLQSIKQTNFMVILSFLYFLLLLVFGTFLDWKHNDNNFNVIPKGLRKAFHPNIADNPGNIFLTAPFYIQLVIAVFCFLAYIGMIKFSYHRYLGSVFNLFFQYFCSGFSFLFTLFSLTNTLYSLIMFIYSTHTNRGLFLINPILTLFSFPALVICLYCMYADIRVTGLPFINISPYKTQIWFFLTCAYAILETLFFALDNNDESSNYWMCIVLVVISLIMTVMTFYRPMFLNIITKVMSSLVSFVLLITSFFSFVQCFSDNIYLPTISFAVSMLSTLFSILYHVIIYIKLNKKIKSQEKIEIKEKKDFILYYSYCSKSNIPKLATKELFDTFEEKNASNFTIQLIILRFLNNVNNLSAVFEKSVNILKILAGNFFNSIQLIGLIEQTSDIVGNSSQATNIRQQQLDSILEQCLSSQLEFWRAVLLDNPKRISECAIFLYRDVKNAQVFFKQLGVDQNSTDQYGIKYVDFLMNVSVDLVELEHVDVDASRPVPYNQRFAMHQPRRDTKPLTPPEIVQPKFAPFALKSDANLEAFPSLLSEPSNKKALISEDRIDLCKSSKKKRLPGENLRIFLFLLFYILMALVSFIFFILVIVNFASYINNALNIDHANADVSSLFNCSISLMNYKSSPFYAHTIPVMQEEVEKCLNFSYDELHYNENIKIYLNYTVYEYVLSNLTKIYEIDAQAEENLIVNPYFYNLGSDLTLLAYDFLSILSNVVNSVSYSSFNFSELVKKLYISSSAIFVILLPFFLATFVSLYLSLKKLFWQPLLIDKAEASNVFQAYQHIASPEKRKSHIRSNQFNRHRTKPRFAFPLYKWTMGSIIFYFFLQYIVCLFFLLIFDSEVNSLTNLSFSLGNCSTVMTHITTNIFRFTPLQYTDDALRFYNWFLSTLNVLRYTVTDFEILNIFQGYDNFTYSVPIVDQNLSLLDDLSIFPINNDTMNQDFHHSIMSAYMVMSEALLIDSKSENTVTRLKDMLYYVQVSNRFFSVVFSLYHDHRNIYLFLAIFVIFLYVILEGFILYLAIMKQMEIRQMINLIIRTMVLLPDRTPLVEPGKTEIHLIDKMPKSPTMKMINSIPIGIIITDKNGNITFANKTAEDFFGSNIKNHKIGDIQYPQMRYFSMTEHTMSQFPKHPFDTEMPNGNYYVYNDTTELNINRLEHTKLQNELKEMRRHRLPSSVTVTRKGQKQNILMMENFAMVEAGLPDEFKEDQFEKLKSILAKKVEPIPTVFLSEFYRDSIVIVFSSFNVQSHKRQFLRDALRCAQFINEYSQHKAKVTVTTGYKCICNITDHELARVSFYAPSMTKAAMMLRFGIYGDIIVEYSLIKTISGIETFSSKVGTGPICNKDVDFCIINHDDNTLKNLFGAVSNANIVFS